jgi:hypothetical protein
MRSASQSQFNPGQTEVLDPATFDKGQNLEWFGAGP